MSDASKFSVPRLLSLDELFPVGGLRSRHGMDEFIGRLWRLAVSEFRSMLSKSLFDLDLKSEKKNIGNTYSLYNPAGKFAEKAVWRSVF